MKSRKLLTQACAFALVANSLATTGALAQDKQQGSKQDKGQSPVERKVERHVIITPDGKRIVTQSGDGQDPATDVLIPNFNDLRLQMDKLNLERVQIPKIDLENLQSQMQTFTLDLQNVKIPQIGFGQEAFGMMPMPLAGMQGGDGIFQFVSTEMSFDVRSVKGAPFSAVTVSESTQALGDGNRITQHTEGHVYRDSAGRTRNERTYRMGGSDKERQTIVIYDPTAHTTITLDPQTRTARKMGPPPAPPAAPAPPSAVSPGAPAAPPAPPSAARVLLNGDAPKRIAVSGGVLQNAAIKRVQPAYPPIAKAAQAQGAVQVQTVINESGNVVEATVISGHPLLRDAATEAARQWEFKPTELGGKPVKVQGVLTFNFMLANKEDSVPMLTKQLDEEQELFQPQPDRVFQRVGGPNTNVKKEELGKQMVEGIECTGTRITTTIPAGAIGNERAIEAVRETWYSPELKTMVMSKSSDPRFGESSYRLTGIARSEPEAQLFQVPDGYTVKENNFKFRTAAPFGGTGEGVRRFEFKSDGEFETKMDERNEIEKKVIERGLQNRIENKIEKKQQQ